MKIYFKIFALVILIFASSFSSAQEAKIEKLKEIEVMISKMQKDWNIPGVAVAIVHKDSIVLAKGFGVKNTESKEKVDSKTLFPVASISKSFTSAAIAKLVSENKLNWDDKVKKHLSYFELYNPYVTENITIADALSHRSGLKTFSGDLLWYGSNYSREEVVKRAAMLKAEFGFRTTFGYSNIMYIASGEIIEKLSGKTWDNYVKDNFFKTLGMNNSYTSFSEIPKNANIVSPHNWKTTKENFPIEFLNWDNIGAAGAIISNVEDMSQWIKFQLNAGIWNNDTLINQSEFVKMRTPHTNFTVDEFNNRMTPSTHFSGYGLGWSLNDYHGYKIIGHSGGYDGSISYLCIIPELDLGFVILTNTNTVFYAPVKNYLLDMLITGESVNWFEMYKNYAMSKRVPKRIELPDESEDLSLDLEKYLGKYKSELYGDAEIYQKEGNLYLDMKQSVIFLGKLNHFDADTFRIRMTKVTALPDGKVYFKINNDKVDSFIIKIDNPDFHFEEFLFVKKD
jgi:CubicO group peptidase (beta-lactamase class C family)